MKKNAISQANDLNLAGINYETSSFEFDYWEWKNQKTLDMFYECTSVKTWDEQLKLARYGILNFERVEFAVDNIKKLYEKSKDSRVVRWMSGIKWMISQGILTPRLWVWESEEN